MQTPIQLHHDAIVSFFFPIYPSFKQTEDEDESFILEDPTLLNTDNIDAHSGETSSLASSDSGDRTNLKR